MKSILINGLAGVALAVIGAHFAHAKAAKQEPPPGHRHDLQDKPLAKPYTTPSAVNGPRVRRRPKNMKPRAPKGFRVKLFAEGLISPRNMAVAKNGDVLVIETSRGRITVLRDTDRNGVADQKEQFASGLRQPYGIAVREPFLYVADLRAVWRYRYVAGPGAKGSRPRQITEDGAIGNSSGHWTRNIALDPNGGHLYVAVGSRGNVGEEEPPRATVQRFNLAGKDQQTFASGLRNPIGLAFHPTTGDLFTVVNERDGLGDDLVPDYLAKIEEGDFFGWPYSYIGANPDPTFGDRRPDLVSTAKVPEVLFQSHSAPIGLTFYTGKQFPKSYLGDAFVALHGSWNSSVARGYTVVQVPFQDGKPIGSYDVFLSGFVARDNGRPEVYGRPTGVAVAADGALLVCDEADGVIWRISYEP